MREKLSSVFDFWVSKREREARSKDADNDVDIAKWPFHLLITIIGEGIFLRFLLNHINN